MNNKAVLIQEQKQALLDLWAALELGEAPHPRQIAVWLLDYDYAAIESALKITANWINKQEEDATPRARTYADGVLRDAVIQKMTPEQREEKLSQMRSLKATIAAKARWQRILALLDWKAPPAQVLPAIPPPTCPCCHNPMTLVGHFARPPPRFKR